MVTQQSTGEPTVGRLCGTVDGTLPRDPERIVEVALESGERIHVPAGLLTPRPDGSYELSIHPGMVRQSDGRETVVIPVAREELRIEKQTRESGRTVVHIIPTARQEVVDLPIMREDVEVERVPVNRVVDRTGPVREEGEVTIIPVFEEVLVVEKRLMLKEEIRITRRRTTEHERKEVTLRSEQVRIENLESKS